MAEPRSRMLIGGCSFTHNAHWPNLVFKNKDIINLGHSGAGNRFISDSIISYVSRFSVDEVFVLFSGINRVDIPVSDSPGVRDLKLNRPNGTIDDMVYFFSGGDKWSTLILENYNNIRAESNWPSIKSLQDFLLLPPSIKQECLQKEIFTNSQKISEMNIVDLIQWSMILNYLDNSDKGLSQLSYNNIINCLSQLQVKNINYKFSFVHDPFDTNFKKIMGCLDRRDPKYQLIDWTKFIPVYPLEIALKYNLTDDGFHLNSAGEYLYAEKLMEYF